MTTPDARREFVPEPRRWAMPAIPDDVTAVTDVDGDVWRRTRRGRWVIEERGNRSMATDDLLCDYGPLTEVLG